MSADANIKTIAEVYQAFGRGDVTAILDAVTDDVDWAAEAASSAAPAMVAFGSPAKVRRRLARRPGVGMFRS